MLKCAAPFLSCMALSSCSLVVDGGQQLSRSAAAVEKGALVRGDRVSVKVPTTGMFLQKGVPTARSINLKHQSLFMETNGYAAMVFPKKGGAPDSLRAMNRRVEARGMLATITREKPTRFQGRPAWEIEQMVHLPGRPAEGLFSCMVAVERPDSVLFLAHSGGVGIAGSEDPGRIRSRFRDWLKSVKLD